MVRVLPLLLSSFGDGARAIQEAAGVAARAIMSKLTGHGVKLVLPHILKVSCGSSEGGSEGGCEGSREGSSEGSSEGGTAGSSEGGSEGSSEGGSEGYIDRDSHRHRHHHRHLSSPSSSQSLEDPAWRAKQGAVQLLASMAFCAPEQLGSALPQVVPKLGEVLSDPHPKVQDAARQALAEVGGTIENPEMKASGWMIVAYVVPVMIIGHL